MGQYPETMGSSYNGVISVRFNQDQTCFTCCTDSGPRIYNIDPLVEKCRYNDVGTIIYCEMLHRTNLLAMVAGGATPKFANNTVLVYDDISKQFVLELTFKVPVKTVRLRRDKIIVCTLHQVCVFSFPAPTQLLFTFETRYNVYGLCEVSPLLTADRHLVIFPSQKIGSVQLVDLCSSEVGSSSAPVTINAHTSELVCLAINQKGTMIATASNKGTLVRVFDTVKRCLIHELRRGSDPAFLYCINFSQCSDFLCCASDKGTVHIFALKDTRLNKRSSLSKIGLLPSCNYAESQWAFANFTVLPECACACAFNSNNSVTVDRYGNKNFCFKYDYSDRKLSFMVHNSVPIQTSVLPWLLFLHPFNMTFYGYTAKNDSSSILTICVDGTFHKYVFNTDGSCKRDTFDRFLDDILDEDS